MLTNEPCKCKPEDLRHCAGFISRSEKRMSVMNPSRTAQEYHEILTLFEAAFNEVEEELYGSSLPTCPDQEDC